MDPDQPWWISIVKTHDNIPNKTINTKVIFLVSNFKLVRFTEDTEYFCRFKNMIERLGLTAE